MAKTPVVYTVAELETMERDDLLTFKKNIEEALSASEEKAMEQVKDMVAKFGIDPRQLALFLGVKAETAPVDTPTSTLNSGTRSVTPKDPELEALKAEYNGKTIIDAVTKKEYTFGKRGQTPKWVRDNIENIRKGQYDFKDDTAPGEVTPEAAE